MNEDKHARISGSIINLGAQQGINVIGDGNNIVQSVSNQLATAESQTPSALWRFTLCEKESLKTKVRATLIIQPPNSGNQAREWEVELAVPTARDLNEIRWYFAQQRKCPDPDRAQNVEGMMVRHGESMLKAILAEHLAVAH